MENIPTHSSGSSSSIAGVFSSSKEVHREWNIWPRLLKTPSYQRTSYMRLHNCANHEGYSRRAYPARPLGGGAASRGGNGRSARSSNNQKRQRQNKPTTVHAFGGTYLPRARYSTVPPRISRRELTYLTPPAPPILAHHGEAHRADAAHERVVLLTGLVWPAPGAARVRGERETNGQQTQTTNNKQQTQAAATTRGVRGGRREVDEKRRSCPLSGASQLALQREGGGGPSRPTTVLCEEKKTSARARETLQKRHGAAHTNTYT